MNKYIRVIKNFCADKTIRFSYLTKLGIFNGLSDEQYLKLKYKNVFGRDLDLENPKTFNEKLQWLKLHNRKPEYTVMADKYLAKKYVASKIGDEYVVPLLGVWDNPEDIDFNTLPDQFVLKCNHNSGTGMYICVDKSKLNIVAVKKELDKGLKENYYIQNREWPYKNIPRKIIAEKFLKDVDDECLTDYKFFCFNGKPEIVYISKDNAVDARTDFFDMDFNHLNIHMKDPNAAVPPSKPQEFEKMKEIATILSKGIPHVRIDLYDISGRIYVGEMTFYHNGGFGPVSPDEWNYKLGQMITLPTMEKETL